MNNGKYYIPKMVFDKKYQKMEFSHFPKSQIKIVENKFFYNENSFELWDKKDDLTKLVLESGLLNPNLINRGQNLKISIITELHLLNPNSQTKRFKFWVYPNQDKNALVNMINPSEYYFELENENATEKTTIENFINGAKLTFFTFGTIIL
ncbi:hypothetical protein [Empedobacter sp.]|uniref:hypothetical protein n=1 Tax=Empedobacter sp. TaxID=1927715 RepID=UPI0028AAC00A|nr:hypothetical protein [Empedobacter sp.]